MRRVYPRTMAPSNHPYTTMLEILESYRAHVAPKSIRPTVSRLLSATDPHHLNELEAIVLTDSASIGKGKTHRIDGRKYSRQECRGFYRPRWRRAGSDRARSPRNPFRESPLYGISLCLELYFTSLAIIFTAHRLGGR